jgi:hypothetical protein
VVGRPCLCKLRGNSVVPVGFFRACFEIQRVSDLAEPARDEAGSATIGTGSHSE